MAAGSIVGRVAEQVAALPVLAFPSVDFLPQSHRGFIESCYIIFLGGVHRSDNDLVEPRWIESNWENRIEKYMRNVKLKATGEVLG